MQDRFYFRYAYNNKIYDVFAVDFFNSTAQLVSLDRAETLFTKIETDKLIQCTGLKDKNGNLIFEGDICIYDFEGIGKQKAVIYFNDTYAGFMVKPLGDFQYTKLNNCRIIGNIYENPELLSKD